MPQAMKASIDAAGRLVVPKRIREQAGLSPGMILEICCRDGTVELKPAPRPVQIVQKGKIHLAVPEEESEPLTEETVRQTREAIRCRHASK